MRYLRQAGAVLALTVLLSSVASAQRTATRGQAAARQGGYWELGGDARLQFQLDDPLTIVIDIPLDILRAGYYASDVLSIEPFASISSSFGKDQTAFTAYHIGVGVVYHLTPDRTKPQTYLRPSLAISSTSGPGNLSFTFLGFGAGLKKPMFNNRMASRVEAGLQHRLETGGVQAATNINIQAGFSVYTR
ncbi:MAG: hypothetical protein WD825_04590 [Gemmatimonadaceae bacterium]